MKIFLDDERQTPDGWHRTYTVEETIAALHQRNVTHLSLDNDLGQDNQEGYNVVDWLEEMVYSDKTFPIPQITVHSSNSSRVNYMNLAIKSIFAIRGKQSEQE